MKDAKRLQGTIHALLVLSAIGLSAPAPAQDVRAGAEAWRKGDFRTAVRQWRGPAEVGDPDAEYGLSQAFRTGSGVPRDEAAADEWLARAARHGNVEARRQLALRTAPAFPTSLPMASTIPAADMTAPIPPLTPRKEQPGLWRIQIGVFSSMANARRQWSVIGPRLEGASPFYAKGKLVILRAGYYRSASAARWGCVASRVKCIVVSPR